MMQPGINTSVVPIELVNAQGQINSILSQAGQVLLTKTETQGVTQIRPGNDIILQSNIQQGTENDNDKRAIYRHPLFPLMALLLEKCELAAATPDAAGADSFDIDIHSFVQQQEQKNKPFLSDDPELDNLMLKSIQVLRIHLLELEKVTDLCQDFCNRYISCLKGKLQSDTLLRVDNIYDESDDMQLSAPAQAHGQQMASMGNNGNSNMSGNVNQGQLVSGGTVYQMVQTPQGIVAQPIQLQTVQQQTTQTIQQQQQQPQQQHQHQQQPQQQQQQQQQTHHQQQQQMMPQVTSASIIHGSTPLSKIGVPATPPQNVSQSALSSALGGDEDENGQSAKRGVLPKQATAIMKSWLFQHIIHPYPTEDEKRQIAQQTNLSLLQVNNWFINARRRILQPMLDSSDPTSIKSKKNKPQQSRPMQRFWPESIANIQPQTSPQSQELNETNSVSNTSTEEQLAFPVGTSYQMAAQTAGSPLRTPSDGSPMTSQAHVQADFIGATSQS